MKKDIPNLELYPYGKQRVEQAKGVTKMLCKIFPFHLLSPLLYELKVLLVRLKGLGKSHTYKKKRRDLLVNIGAGPRGQVGWINIDVYQVPNINCIYDARKRLPFAAESVKGIFCEHFFEHLDYTSEVPHFLSECHRVLNSQGVLRLIVPDAKRYLEAYVAGGWESLSELRPLVEKRLDPWLGDRYNTRMELINAVFRQGSQHKYAYDYETLAFLLSRYGFKTVQQQTYQHSWNPELCLDWKKRASESLYVEGRK